VGRKRNTRRERIVKEIQPIMFLLYYIPENEEEKGAREEEKKKEETK
jgi:uncharacterized protein Veg